MVPGQNHSGSAESPDDPGGPGTRAVTGRRGRSRLTIGYREAVANSMTGANTPSRGMLASTVLGAVLALSVSSVLIRFVAGTGVPLLAVAALRMALATLMLAPFFVADRQRAASTPAAPMSVRDRRQLIASGLLLAVHFGAWTQSLGEISIARSVLLVSTHPAFTVIGERLFLGRALRPSALIGTLVAVSGAGLMVLAEGSAAGGSLLGDGLALLGAVSISAYFLLGRRLRGRLPLLSYVTPLYAVTAIGIVAVALPLGAWGWPVGATGWLALAGLAIFPTILGHMIMSWAIRHLSATAVSTSFLGEAVGAALLAWLILGQVPETSTIPGGVAILLGIAIVLGGSSDR